MSIMWTIRWLAWCLSSSVSHFLINQNYWNLKYEEEGESTKSFSITRITKAYIPTIITEKQFQPFPLIHALTKVDCPRLLIKIATKLYPNELNKLDVNGYTPLALAAQIPIFREHDLSDEGYCIED